MSGRSYTCLESNGCDAVAEGLPGMASQAASIHLERRVFHVVAASLLPVGALLLPLLLVQGLALAAAVALVSAEVARRLSPRLNRLFVGAFGRMMRPAEEQGRITGATYLVCASPGRTSRVPPIGGGVGSPVPRLGRPRSGSGGLAVREAPRA